ncbi:hypothetical protein [Negativicoccus succinicivorans]|uniref:hypothetical protein n=1 Tax=Negativicoccus succinicivorans TaxID=620903 RepID=UPI0029037760|nr:hypothetical protein [Negativicoccus succinicivorans]MDU2929048.1 hypothetical protein [Negativicoccus succinicivorans]
MNELTVKEFADLPAKMPKRKPFKRQHKQGLNVHIKATAYRASQIKEIVQMAADIQKEHRCDCTLFVNTDQCFELSGGES